MRQGRTTREEAQHNERADHAAEEGRMLHRGACRGLMIHYRRILATYQQLVTEVRAHMLMVVKKVMDVMSEKEPEEMMNKREEEGYTFFGGLNPPRCGELQRLRRLRSPGAVAFAEATSITRKALMQFLEQLEYVEETQDGVPRKLVDRDGAPFRNTARGLPAEKMATQPHLGGAAHSEGSAHHAACGGLQRGYARSSEGSLPSAGEAAIPGRPGRRGRGSEA